MWLSLLSHVLYYKWIVDKVKIAAIWTMGKYSIQKAVFQTNEGFMIAKVIGVFVCSF